LPDHPSRAGSLESIEIATGVVFGCDPRPFPQRVAMRPPDALAAAVRPAVGSGRCFVSFSGGRDSSAVLAAATAVARRERLPLPVPVTIRASDAPESDESSWQESVVRHLGIDDWVRLDVCDELDAVGPYARRAMVRHGLLWPFNAHFHSPMLQQATGGTLLTGIGGDELWSSSTAQPMRLRRRLLQFAPPLVRRAVLAPRIPIDFPWLTREAVGLAQRLAVRETASVSRNAYRRMLQSYGMRSTGVGTAALTLLAEDADAAIAHPLLDLRLWAAVSAAAPRRGFSPGGGALAATAGELLPAELVRRSTKASFDAVFFHDHARAVARDWSGHGVPSGLVDEARLRDHWMGEAPDAHSLTLLQAAWMADCGMEERLPKPDSTLA
jgi:hypothetical protein